jgi:heme exporter protein A
MSVALEASRLSKRFGRTLAVNDVTVSLDGGSAVAVLGPNGAGKTTFLRLGTTLLRPSSGTIHLLGMDTASQGSAVRRRIGFLGHESLLYPDLTAAENLLFYARLFRIRDSSARIQTLIERMGLSGWANRPVRTLSRGLLQRCALARVLIHQPEILFLDEPFTGLDLEARENLCEVLSETHLTGTTILMSTHDLEAGFRLCTSALVFVRGRLAWQGSISPAERPAFETHYRTLTHSDEVSTNPNPPPPHPQTTYYNQAGKKKRKGGATKRNTPPPKKKA